MGRRDVMLGMAAAGLGAAPPPDLGTLLAAVAARYAGLTCYTLGITHWREMGGGRKTMRLVYGDEAHFRFEAPESVLVADGDFCWQYRAEGREYLREPVGQVDARVRAEFNRLREQFVGRFRELPRLLPVARAMGEQRVPGTKLFVFDEAQRYLSPNVTPPNLRTVVNRGRRRGLDVVFISRSPMECGPKMRREITEVVTFPFTEPGDLDWLSAYGFDPERVSALPLHGRIVRDRFGREKYEGAASPSGAVGRAGGAPAPKPRPQPASIGRPAQPATAPEA